jgi:hypothetical protein
MLKEKIRANFQRIIEKLSPSSQKYGFGIRDPEKTYSGSRSGSRGQKGTGSWIPDPDPQHCFFLTYQRQLFFQSVSETVERLLSWPASVLRIRIRDNKFFPPSYIAVVGSGIMIRDLDPDPDSDYWALKECSIFVKIKSNCL